MKGHLRSGRGFGEEKKKRSVGTTEKNSWGEKEGPVKTQHRKKDQQA